MKQGTALTMPSAGGISQEEDSFKKVPLLGGSESYMGDLPSHPQAAPQAQPPTHSPILFLRPTQISLVSKCCC